MTLIGSYLLANTIQVSSTFWGYRYHLFGNMGISAFGVTLILFLLGIGIVFFDYRLLAGRLLTAGSLLLMLVGVIANLKIYFGPTSLYVTLIMFALLAGGLGLIARSLRDHS